MQIAHREPARPGAIVAGAIVAGDPGTRRPCTCARNPARRPWTYPYLSFMTRRMGGVRTPTSTNPPTAAMPRAGQ